MNKPHLLKHNGVWIIREEMDNQGRLCEGCIGEGNDRKCNSLPECSYESPFNRINYIFKEFQE